MPERERWHVGAAEERISRLEVALDDFRREVRDSLRSLGMDIAQRIGQLERGLARPSSDADTRTAGQGEGGPPGNETRNRSS